MGIEESSPNNGMEQTSGALDEVEAPFAAHPRCLAEQGEYAMGLFGKKESERVQVAGLTLRCEICKNERFWAREAQLNTAVATFFSFDWANATAECYVCDRCGYIHWFLPKR